VASSEIELTFIKTLSLDGLLTAAKCCRCMACWVGWRFDLFY